MIKKQTLGLFALFTCICLSKVQAQTQLHIRNGCNFYGEETETAYYQFEPNSEAQQIVNELLQGSGLSGSFVTKKENPSDIDFVTFIDATIFERNEVKLEEFWSFSLEEEGLDAYIVKIYPADSPLFVTHTEHFKKVWFKRFCRTKTDTDLDIAKKGFIKLKFNNS